MTRIFAINWKTHLAGLRRQGMISSWHDRRITAGEDMGVAIDSHINTADVVLLLISPQDEACLRLEIEDAGKGIPPEKESLFGLSAHPGVGFRGMRERLRQLCGTLQVRSNWRGTKVIAVLPIERTTVVPLPDTVVGK